VGLLGNRFTEGFSETYNWYPRFFRHALGLESFLSNSARGELQSSTMDERVRAMKTSYGAGCVGLKVSVGGSGAKRGRYWGKHQTANWQTGKGSCPYQ
jgi:hypothetical protein